MAKTQSSMRDLGSTAPDFDLPEPLSGETLSLDALAGFEVTVVMFICNHCPFVKHLLDGLIDFGKDYDRPQVGMVAISSNDVTGYPQDRPERMAELADAKDFPFPYLYDQSQEVARAYDATCTPDFFVFNDQRKLVYRGQFDDSRPGNGRPVTGADLRAAVNALLLGQQVNPEQKPSVGCNIKWKTD
jgi:peroxiredoxin